MIYSFRPNFSQRKVLAFLQKNISIGTLTVRVDEKHIVSFGNGCSPKAGISLPALSTLLKIAINPDPGFGEAFMKGEMEITDCELEDLLCLLKLNFTNDGNAPSRLASLIAKVQSLRFFLSQYTSIKAAVRRVQHHYDIGNDLYSRFLDPEMQYSCAFWSEEIKSLEDAQLNKMHLTTKRLEISQANTRVVDIGCGWGGLSHYIQKTTGAHVDGITLSREQYDWAITKRDEMPEADRQSLTYHLKDYRLFADENVGKYDRVVSVGMFEHVGHRQFTTYFDKIARLMKPGGQAVIHMILRPRPDFTSPWIDRYIFPGGYIPTSAEVESSSKKSGLTLRKMYLHEGRNYARTLMAWRDRFRASADSLDPVKYDTRFKRMWEFYLGSCINAFEVEPYGYGMQVGQFVFVKP